MARLRDIVIDCAAAPALARFWAEALDGYRVRQYDDLEIARLAERGLTPDTDPTVAVDGPGPTLFLQETASRPQASRSRLHLDLVADDSPHEIARLCALGATVREEREGYTVLLDPEGNAFCLLDSSRDA